MNKEKIKLERQHRQVAIESGNINETDMTVDLSFSSEEPVERWFGMEILSHKKGDVDMSRLNDSAAVLVNHTGDQIGVVEKAQIKSKKGVARLRFSKNSELARTVFQDIVDGIRKNVSVGYRIIEFVLDRQDENGLSTYRASWEPGEISIVGVPADKTVGVGRSLEETDVEVPEGFPVRKTEEDKIEKANELRIVDGKIMRGEVEVGDEAEIRKLIGGQVVTEERLQEILDGKKSKEDAPDEAKVIPLGADVMRKKLQLQRRGM